jgi:hypothetical protein
LSRDAKTGTLFWIRVHWCAFCDRTPGKVNIFQAPPLSSFYMEHGDGAGTPGPTPCIPFGLDMGQGADSHENHPNGLLSAIWFYRVSRHRRGGWNDGGKASLPIPISRFPLPIASVYRRHYFN